MIESDKICGTCQNAFHLKEFRNADVFVCQTCKTVTVSKSDFKRLLGGQLPATPAPAPVSIGAPESSMDLGDTSAAIGKDEPSMGFLRTEETEEFPSGPEVGTMAPTEIAGPSYDDSAYVAEATEREGPGYDEVPYSIQGEDDLDDATFEAELAAYKARRQRSVLIAGVSIVVVLGLVGVLAVGAGLAGMFATADTEAPLSVEPTALPEPVAEPAAEPEPEPVADPEPAAPPTPAAPQPTGVGALVRQGWNAFDRSPAEAEGHFRRALDVAPAHADANYGYGYALLKQGRATEATPYLCKAQQTGDAEISRDIRALLTHNGLSCE